MPREAKGKIKTKERGNKKTKDKGKLEEKPGAGQDPSTKEAQTAKDASQLQQPSAADAGAKGGEAPPASSKEGNSTATAIGDLTARGGTATTKSAKDLQTARSTLDGSTITALQPMSEARGSTMSKK